MGSEDENENENVALTARSVARRMLWEIFGIEQRGELCPGVRDLKTALVVNDDIARTARFGHRGSRFELLERVLSLWTCVPIACSRARDAERTRKYHCSQGGGEVRLSLHPAGEEALFLPFLRGLGTKTRPDGERMRRRGQCLAV